MISIIIPIYNQADKLPNCLDSLLAQSYKDYELIIVDDGSTDNLQEITRNYNSKFKKFKLVHQENKGANSARNKGAELSEGNLLLFLDADIIMHESMLSKMKSTLDNNQEASFTYSSHKFGSKTFKLFPYTAERLKEMPYIHTSSLIRRKYFPGFDNDLKRMQDWDLWLTMMKQGHQGVWINEILFQIQEGGTMSSWLPSFTYKLFPFLPQVKKYNKAKKIIQLKHNLQ